jgi:uracil-DNA glycosylase family protein
MANAQRSAAEFIPVRRSLAALRTAAKTCRGCDLYRDATQTVFGEGSARATIMLIGEQPGDKEDLTGHPFVGPAGLLLDTALREAGIDRDAAYVTNAVKHFKYIERGKRRIHQSPKVIEIRACQPWLEAEIAAVKPRIIIALGATAARALFGPAFRLTQQRGTIFSQPDGPAMLATIHPSAILRSFDHAAREAETAHLIADLRVARDALK